MPAQRSIYPGATSGRAFSSFPRDERPRFHLFPARRAAALSALSRATSGSAFSSFALDEQPPVPLAPPFYPLRGSKGGTEKIREGG